MKRTIFIAASFATVAVFFQMTVFDYGALSYIWPRWAALPFVVMGMGAWAVSAPNWKVDALDSIAACFVIWAWLSLLWSADRDYSMLCATRLSELMLLWHFARRIDLSLWLPVLSAAVCLIALGAEITNRAEYGIFGNYNNEAEFFLIAAPLIFGAWASAVLWRFKLSGAMGGIGILIVLYLAVWSTGHLQFLVLAVALIYFAARKNIKAAVAVGILFALFVGLYLDAHPDFISGRYSHVKPRLHLWFITSIMWWDHSILGVGLGGYERWFPDYQSLDQKYLPMIHSEEWDSPNQRSGNAHSDYLHLAAELGIVGLGLALSWVTIAWRGAKWSAAKISLGIAIILAAIDFPMQKPEVATLAMLVCASATRIKTQ